MARVDRIALLLAELDNLVPLSAEVSAGLTQALATISEVEEKLTKRGSGRPARAAVDGDGGLIAAGLLRSGTPLQRLSTDDGQHHERLPPSHVGRTSSVN